MNKREVKSTPTDQKISSKVIGKPTVIVNLLSDDVDNNDSNNLATTTDNDETIITKKEAPDMDKKEDVKVESNIQEVLIKTTKETTKSIDSNTNKAKSIDSNTNKEEDNNMVDMDVMIPYPIREPEETITPKERPNTSDTTMPDDINQQQLQKQHERGQLQFKTTKKDWVIDPKKRKLIDIGSVARGIAAKTKMTTKNFSNNKI